jgi:hypothetical protein
MLVPAQSGGSIQVKNFLQDKDTVADSINQGQYYVGPHFTQAGVTDPTASDHPPFVIDYDSKNQLFNILLNQEPLNQTRQQAESYLGEKLGITHNDMCRLKYTISAPNYVNSYYAGQNLFFSFCNGAVKLAQ